MAQDLPGQLELLARHLETGARTLEQRVDELAADASDRKRLEAWRGLYLVGLWSDVGMAPARPSEQRARQLIPQALALADRLGDRGTRSLLLAYAATTDYWPSMKPFSRTADLDAALSLARESGDADALCLVLVRKGESGFHSFRVSDWSPFLMEAIRLAGASPVCRAYATYVHLGMNGYLSGTRGLGPSEGIRDSDAALQAIAGRGLDALEDRLVAGRTYMLAAVSAASAEEAKAAATSVDPAIERIIQRSRERGDAVSLMGGLVFKANALASSGKHQAALASLVEATQQPLAPTGRFAAVTWALVIARSEPGPYASRVRGWLEQTRSLVPPDAAPRPRILQEESLRNGYVALGDFARAFEHSENASQIQRALSFEVQTRDLDEFNVRYATQQKELENERLRRSETELVGRRNALAVGLVVSLIALVLVGWLMAAQWRQRRQITALYGQLERLNANRSQLIAAACHDLRQPAFALSVISEVVASQPQEAVSRIEDIRRNALMLGDMLSDLLDLNRLDSGHLTVSRSEMAIQPLLDEVRSQFQSLCARKHLRLEVTPTKAWVKSDPQLLRRIVFNLVSNAVKYTQVGYVKVHVEEGPDNLRLLVEDSGRGIPADRIEDMLRPYSRMDHTDSEQGLGIGLSVVQRAVKLLDYQLDIRSKVHKGTTVAVGLGPASPEPAQAVQQQDMALPAGATVAVLDDSSEVREALVRLFGQWGLRVVDAESGPQLIERLRQRGVGRPLALITDYSLGSLSNGLETALQVRAGVDDPELPVLLLTANVSEEVEIDAHALGIQVMLKPARPLRLRQALSRMASRLPRAELTT